VDGRAPRIGVRVKHRQRVLRTGVLQLRVRCDEQCTLRTGGAMEVRRRGHASAARSALALTRTRRTLAAGALVRVRLRVPARARRAVRRALARHGRKVTARLVLSATDGAGNTGRRTVLVSVRRGCPSTGLARVFV
jgi:hypothetical protein